MIPRLLSSRIFFRINQRAFFRSSSDDSVPIFLVRGGTQLEGHAAQLDDIQPLRAHAVYIQLEQRKITLIAGRFSPLT